MKEKKKLTSSPPYPFNSKRNYKKISSHTPLPLEQSKKN
jgi:hypothetical protein